MADRRLFPALRLLAIAAAAGAVAGLVAVYVSAPGSGNDTAPAGAAVVSATDDSCADETDVAKGVGAAATGTVAAMLPADPPQSMRSLAFDSPDGKPMTIADHAGKTVLLNLWATWCAPCRAEMPALDRLQADLGGGRFEVVAGSRWWP